LVTIEITKEIEVASNAKEVKGSNLYYIWDLEGSRSNSYNICNQIGARKAWKNGNNAKKIRFDWHTKVNSKIHEQVFKLALLSLGSTIITLTSAIML
jgi:hypothetical protein